MTTDVVIAVNNETCVYDMFIDQNGDFANGDFFDTSLLYSLLGERRASASEVPVSQNRRGWIGNEGKDFENGSKLWLYYQARISRTVLNGVADAAFRGLSWLVEDGLVVDITTNAILQDGVVILIVEIERFNSVVERRYYELWENTGVL